MSPKSKRELLNEEIDALINVNPDEPVPDWHKDAACRGMPGELADKLFYPTDIKDPNMSQRRSICFPCPVRAQCEAWGNLVAPRYGCYGGFNPNERRARSRGVA